MGSALANYDYDFAHYYEYVYPDQTKTAPVAQLPPLYMYYSQSVPVQAVQVPQQIAEAPKVFAEEVPVIQVFNNKEAPAVKEIQKEEPVQLQEVKEAPAPQAAQKEAQVQESQPIKKETEEIQQEQQQQQQEVSAELKKSPKVYLDYYVSR